MSKFSNPNMPGNTYSEAVKSPVRIFITHSAKTGTFRTYDSETQKKTTDVKSVLNMQIVDIRHKLGGEMKDGSKIYTPLFRKFTYKVPVWTSGLGGEKSVHLGDFVWSDDKKRLAEHPRVQEINSYVILFCVFAYQSDRRIIQLELSGYDYNAWINATKGVDMTENFMVKIRPDGIEVANTHPKAKSGDKLLLPSFEFYSLDEENEGDVLYWKSTREAASLINAYLEDRTYQHAEIVVTDTKPEGERENPLDGVEFSDLGF